MDENDRRDGDALDELLESFLVRHRRGEHPRVEEYVDKYPHLADRIRALFPTLCAIEELASDARSEVGGEASGGERGRQHGQ